MIRGLLSGLLVLVVMQSSAHAQPEPSSQPDQVFKVSVNLVVVDAQVLSKKTGREVMALAPQDFQLYENGVQQKIISLSQDELPLSIVFLFDLTDSVGPVLDSLAKGALQALQHLKPGDEAAVMVYAASAELLQDFTTDHGLMVNAINRASKMDSREAAFFNEGIFQAASEFKNSRNRGRRVIIWLTDNQPNVPSEEMKRSHGRSLGKKDPHTRAETLTELFKKDAVVCTLLERSTISEDAFSHNLSDPMYMLGRRQFPPGDVYEYSQETGGAVVESASPSKASVKLAELIDQIRNRYAVGYHPSAGPADGTFHQIELQVSPEVQDREGKVIVRARRGYYR